MLLLFHSIRRMDTIPNKQKIKNNEQLHQKYYVQHIQKTKWNVIDMRAE